MAQKGGGNEEGPTTDSRFRGGAPTMNQVQQYGNEVEKSKQSPYMMPNPVFIAGDPAATHAANVGKFPIRPLARDDYDTYWEIKHDLSHDKVVGNKVVAAAATPARPLPFTQEDIAYLKRKRDNEEFAGYLFWQASKYDLNDPATREWFHKVCPGYFQQRESLVEEQIDLAARYAKIRLRGAKNEDDLKLEYFIETDKISLPKGPLWDPYLWIEAEADVPKDASVATQSRKLAQYNERSYQKGLFNPTRVMTPQTGGLIQNPFNRGDIAGMPKTNYTGVYGANVSTLENYNAAYGPGNGNLYGGLAGFRRELRNTPNSTTQAILQENNRRIRQATRISTGNPFPYTNPAQYPRYGPLAPPPPPPPLVPNNNAFGNILDQDE